MIKAKGMVFGDGLMELIPDETEEEKVIWLDDLREEPESRKVKNDDLKTRNVEKPAKRYAKTGIHDALILISVIAPFIMGFLWAGVMVQHEAVYIVYWELTFAWAGIVMFANRRKHGRKKD